MNRRDFLKASATAGLAVSTFGEFWANAAEDSKPYRVGLIGSGVVRQERFFSADPGGAGRSRLHLRPGQEDAGRRDRHDRAAAEVKKAAARVRRLSGDAQGKDLDMVVIGSPDHWHAPQCIAALEAGAHVYVQKPISVDVLIRWRQAPSFRLENPSRQSERSMSTTWQALR
jgi:hypothetical protein